MIKERFALLSVHDKRGVVELGKALVERGGYRLLSTGGTADALRKSGVPVIEVSRHTRFPEMMEGRVKTLHPKIHGGILCRRDSPEQLAQAEAHAIGLIDVVVVNLYPFEETVAQPDCRCEEAIEQIDIGGPVLLRSAAKNYASVTVLCDPADYVRFLKVVGDEESLSALRCELACKVFQRTASYDQAIATYFEAQQQAAPDMEALAGFPETVNVGYTRACMLRYGENPHQKAALYGDFLKNFTQVQGKPLSYNNLIDITAAVYLIGEFERPTVAILKHTNPCGVASADVLKEAWHAALATDGQAPFGGIIVVNRTLDADVAKEIQKLFCEVVVAPGCTPEAQAIFADKPNLRLMLMREKLGDGVLQDVRSVIGGVVLQDRDVHPISKEGFNVVTERSPTSEEWTALLFGWRVVKHVKSNAIVYAAGERTLGIGAGQMSRLDSSKIAVQKARDEGLSLEGSVVASDAFFPFSDGLLIASEAGATAAIQPGGSIRDEAVITAANEHKMAMVFTGMRHFRH